MISAISLRDAVQLAEASYVLLDQLHLPPHGTVLDDDSLRVALQNTALEGLFSGDQARDLVQSWALVSHQPNTASGFSASIFQRKDSPSTYVLAIRGTELRRPASEFIRDFVESDLGGVIYEGIAVGQIVDLYNYWKCAVADRGQTVRLARVVPTSDANAANVFAPALDGLFYRVEFFDRPNAGLGVFDGPISNLTVTGHSLGGHLSTAFSRLFPDANADVVTVNSMGTRESTLVQTFFDVLAERDGTQFDESRIANVVGSAGPDIAAGEIFYTQHGVRAEIYTESASIGTTAGHGAGQMTDSASVYDLFIRSDAALHMKTPAQVADTLFDVFRAASPLALLTLESLENVLGELFVPGYSAIAGQFIDHRGVLHQRQSAIRNAMPSSGLTMVSLTSSSATALISLATNGDLDGKAYRYALKEGNPFAVLGPGSIYELHNASAQLELHDPRTGAGALSDVWIQDRATLLTWKVRRNIEDNRGFVLSGGSVESTATFIDRPNDPLRSDTIQVVSATQARMGVAEPAIAKAPMYVFGDEEAEQLSGGANADHIFGEGGDDTLIGGFGNDYLEGGRGSDTYVYASGHGLDTVLDVDGVGRILFDGIALGPGERVAPYQWRFTSEVGREFFYWLSNEKNGSRSVTITAAETPGSIHVLGYRDGSLGILLHDFTSDERPAGEIEAGTEVNDILGHPFQPVKLGLGGDDILWGKPDFWLEGGSGNDWLAYAYSIGDPARGLSAYGGEGSDLLFGTVYDDGLHAEDVADFAALVNDASSSEARPEREVLFGGAGDDVVAGGRGNDWIAGGIGSDVLHGGAGDDILSGAGEIFMEVTQPGLDPQAATIFNVHTSGRYDQTLPAIRINVPHGLLDFGFTAADLGTVLRDGLDESGWRDGGDIILAGRGDDEAWGGFGDDFISGDEGNDTVIGERGNDALYGGDGDDHLLGGEGSDVLVGGAGADLLEGGAGDDTYEVDGFDTVRDTEGNNRIRFGTEVPRDTLHAVQSGATLILTGVGGGTLTIEAGFAGAIAEVDIEHASFTFGEFLSSIAAEPLHIQGGAGNEALFGASANDRIAGGKGFDVMEGGRGDDVYVLNLGDGFDVLTDLDGRNVIEFGAGINAPYVTASVLFNSGTGSYDMHVGYGLGDMVAITYGHAGAIAEYRFDNDEVLTHADVVARAAQGFSLAGTEAADVSFGGGGNDSLTGDGGDDVLIGQAGNDSMSGASGDDRLSGAEGNDRLFGDDGADMLNGGSGDDELLGGEGNDLLEAGEGNDLLKAEAGDDTLRGGAGNDLLEGGAGDDIYVVTPGDGTDILRDVAGSNTMRFTGAITPESLSGSILNGTDGGIYLSLQIGESDRLLVKQDPLRPGTSGDVFSFASGENLTQTELMARVLSTPLDYVAGPNAITLYGSRFDDRVLGSEQTDFIDGGAGDDLLQGEGGADILVGGPGDDVLLGGTGDDILGGGPGNDIYALRQGMGRDAVTEDPADTGINTLLLGAGLALADLAADRQGEDLYLHQRDARDGVIIIDYFAAPGAADAWQVQTGDGTLAPLGAVIAGIQETPRAATVAQAFEQFEQRVKTAYASALYSAGWTPFSDGRFHHESTFDSRFFSSHVVREVGMRTVTQAEDGAFVLRESQPVLLTDRTVSESLSSQTVQVLDTSNSRVVPVQDGGSAELMAGEPMTVLDVEDLVQSGLSGIELPHTVIPISDGQTVARPYSADPTPKRRVSSVATYMGGATPIYATQTVTHRQQEVLESWEMQIAGIVAGDSDNIIDARWGFSLVDAGAGNDLVLAQGGIFLPSLELRTNGIPGALLYGNDGHDELRGTEFDDVLIGGPGNDTIRGGKGNDIYFVFSGDGSDLIFDDGESVSGVARENVIEMPDGVSLADLTVTHATVLQAGRYAAANHDSLLVSPYVALDLAWAGGAVRIVVPHTDQNAALGIEAVRFADASSATLEELFGRAGGMPDLNPHNQDNTQPGIVWGGGGDDVLVGNGVIGGAGRDTLIGSESDDELFGGEMVVENDFADLTGGSASLSTLWDEGNIYRGARGDDTLWTTAGSDVFEYDIGDGADTVTDMLHDNTFLHGYGGPIGSAQHHLPHWQDPTAVDREHQALLFSGSDTLKFGPGILPQDVEVYRWGESGLKPHLLFAVGSGGVRFDNWYRAQINQLGRVEFTDATPWDASAIAARAFEARILVLGSDADDILVGGPEDEAFQGGEGSDTYRFGPGSGRDHVREAVSTADTDTLEVLAHPDDVVVTRENDNLVVALGGGADRVAIEWFRDRDARIEKVTFADGTVWDAGALEAQTQGATNQAPTVAHPLPDQPALEDVPLTYVVADDTFNEPDVGDVLTYTAANLPQWLSFDPATRTFSGTPLNEHVGSYPLHVIATDSGDLSAADEFVLTVLNVNDAPSVAIALEERVVDAGSPFILTLPAETFADPDAGDALVFSASLFGGGALPAWLSFDAASATFSGTPEAQHIGIWHLVVTATDLADESASSDFGLIVRSQAGATVKGDSGDDLLYGNSGAETLNGKAGNDYLFGDAGDDVLKGGTGDDILQGGDGSDVLRAGTGGNLLDGGAGDDLIYSGPGASVIIGGLGNDTIRTGHGADVILFNRGDGRDTIIADRSGDNTLSFGGGIRYSDLTFARDGKDLIVDAGGGDQLTLKDWYAGKQSVLNLQIIHDASDEFDATSTDPLYNRRGQTFDFRGLVRSFEGVSDWALSDALLQWHLASLDDEALGGDLAYWYGKNRGLSGISIQAAQQVLGAPGFGSEAHSLRPFEGLTEGLAKLA